MVVVACAQLIGDRAQLLEIKAEGVDDQRADVEIMVEAFIGFGLLGDRIELLMASAVVLRIEAQDAFDEAV